MVEPTLTRNAKEPTWREDLDGARCPDPECPGNHDMVLACGGCGSFVMGITYERMSGMLVTYCAKCNRCAGQFVIASRTKPH